MCALRVSTIVVTLVLIAACSREPVSVSSFQLGKSLNPDNTVGTHTTRFQTDDTIYVSVLTAGSGSATLGVRWLYAGRVVSEPKKEVSYKGEAATEFHIQNSGGFPTGDYTVEVLLNGKPAGSREFRVDP